MFRKFWKTLKIFIIVIVVLICLPRSILPHQTTQIEENVFDVYVKLNNSEERLPEFKDTDEALRLKLMQLDLINKSRKRYNAGELKLDILASRVANKMCREAAENNYMGHWNLAGEKPYQRYAAAGGYDHVTENAYGEWSTDEYVKSDSKISSMMKTGHEKFMAERSPYDGHKKTIINKSHNFVGIGNYLSGKQFRYYEEFIDRYLEFENIPAEVKADEPFSITVKRSPDNYLYFLLVYHENFPEPITPSKLMTKGSYDDYTDEEYLNLFAWDLARYRNGMLYKIPLKFSREGIYYIQIYCDNKEITGPSSLDTKGKTPASGIVIRVNKLAN
jgi:hypothetical protein